MDVSSVSMRNAIRNFINSYQWSCDHAGLFRIQGQEGDLVAKSQVAGEDNFLNLRTNIPKIEENLIPIEERGTERETEEAIAKKYQHWQDMRMKLSKDDISNVKRAREEGRLHTELLDRRAGMKSDKYCK